MSVVSARIEASRRRQAAAAVRQARAAAWVTYCAQSWPDLPRDLVERYAAQSPTIYHLRQRVLEALELTGEHCP